MKHKVLLNEIDKIYLIGLVLRGLMLVAGIGIAIALKIEEFFKRKSIKN